MKGTTDYQPTMYVFFIQNITWYFQKNPETEIVASPILPTVIFEPEETNSKITQNYFQKNLNNLLSQGLFSVCFKYDRGNYNNFPYISTIVDHS